MDIENMTDAELKVELGIVLRELQNRNILYCLKCGETDFFRPDCKECIKTEKKIKKGLKCIVCDKRKGTSKADGDDLYCDSCREKAELG